PAATPLRARGARRSRGLDQGTGRRAAGPRPPAPERRLRADRRRAPLARRAGGGPGHGAGGDPGRRRPRHAAARPCRERRARGAGAKTKKPRTTSPVDPALAARAREAAQRLTGLSARIAGGRLEIAFADETQLEELVEALERATP